MKCKLSEIAAVKGGKRLPKGVNLISTPNAHPYIRVRDLNGQRTLELNDEYEFVDEETQKKIARCIVKKGDIVLSIVGTIGLVSIVGESLDNANLTENCVKIIVSEAMDSKFLYYYLKSSVGQTEIMQRTVGAVQAKLPIKNIQDIDVWFPPKETQTQIASVLSYIDDKIEHNNKINANLQQQAQAIFKSWFVDFEPFQDGEFVESELGPIPKGWKVISLENVCSVITKGTTPTTLKRRFTDCGINYIKAESISNAHFIDKNKIAYIDQETHELLSRSKIQENDILFTIAGTLGRFCMVDKENVPANTNQAVAIIRADISKIHPCVLYSYFLGDWHTEYCHTRVQQAVQANLSLGTLKNMQIPYPDEVTMEKYRSIVEPLIAEVQRTNRENVALENLRNALIPKLMNGEIDVEGVAD